MIDEKLQPILNDVLRRNAGETEFLQAVQEVLRCRVGRLGDKPGDDADENQKNETADPQLSRVPSSSPVI